MNWSSILHRRADGVFEAKTSINGKQYSAEGPTLSAANRQLQQQVAQDAMEDKLEVHTGG